MILSSERVSSYPFHTFDNWILHDFHFLYNWYCIIKKRALKANERYLSICNHPCSINVKSIHCTLNTLHRPHLKISPISIFTFCSWNYKCAARFTKRFSPKIAPKRTNKEILINYNIKPSQLPPRTHMKFESVTRGIKVSLNLFIVEWMNFTRCGAGAIKTPMTKRKWPDVDRPKLPPLSLLCDREGCTSVYALCHIPHIQISLTPR